MTQPHPPQPGPSSRVVSSNQLVDLSTATTKPATAVPAKLRQRKPSIEERLPAGVYANRPQAKGYSKLHWTWFWVYVWLRLYKLRVVSPPSVSTREMIARHKLGIMQDAEKTQLTAVTVNQKGGTGKTPVATAVAALFAWVTQQATLLVDANQTKGNTASRIGVKSTMAIREAVGLFEQTRSIPYEVLVRVFARHPAAGYGSLRVIDSDTHEGRKVRLGYPRVLAFFRGIKPAMHSMIFDCGNTTDGAPTRAAVEFADVPMFVARLSQENALTDCLDTMNHYRGINPEKVMNGVVVIVDHRHYRFRRARNTTAQDYAKFFDFPVEQVVLIPHDAFYPVKQLNKVENPDDLIKVIMAEKLHAKTVVAYLGLIRELFALQRKADALKGSIPVQEMVIRQPEELIDVSDDDPEDLLDPVDAPGVLPDEPVNGRPSALPLGHPLPSTAEHAKELIATTHQVGDNRPQREE